MACTLIVDLDGDWQHYTDKLPPGSKALGTVTQINGKKGALIRIGKSGPYALVGSEMMHWLDTRMVQDAISRSLAPKEVRSEQEFKSFWKRILNYWSKRMAT